MSSGGGRCSAADEHCAHLVEEAILVEEEAGAARVGRQCAWQSKTWLTRDRTDTTATAAYRLEKK